MTVHNPHSLFIVIDWNALTFDNSGLFLDTFYVRQNQLFWIHRKSEKMSACSKLLQQKVSFKDILSCLPHFFFSFETLHMFQNVVGRWQSNYVTSILVTFRPNFELFFIRIGFWRLFLNLLIKFTELQWKNYFLHIFGFKKVSETVHFASICFKYKKQCRVTRN